MKKTRIPFVLFAIILLFNTCATLSKKEEYLNGRTLYLKKFKYIEIRSKKETAFMRMKDFPADYLFKFLAHKYNIKIDTTAFEKFIVSEDISAIKASGLLFDVEFLWEDKNEYPDAIEIVFGKNPDPNYMQSQEQEYRVRLITDGKAGITISNKIPYNMSVIELIPKDLGYKKIQGNVYLYKKTKEEINLSSIDFRPEGTVASQTERVDYSEATIEDLKLEIKKYLADKPVEEKKKLRDDLIKYLYTIIE